MSSTSQEARSSIKLSVYDHRNPEKEQKDVEIGTNSRFSVLKKKIQKAFSIPSGEQFVIERLDDREALDDDESIENLSDGDALLIQDKRKKDLDTPIKRRISFQPHYDTIVKSGLYEYYAHEGRDPLPYAFCELIDNALSASYAMKDERKIEIRLYLDGPQKEWMVCVLDNGKGMDFRELNDWAVMRLSKFRTHRRHASTATEPLFLNSDISFFGVGGKQAIFSMGEAVRMVSKSENSTDVCELVMSKNEFKERERQGAAIYEADIIQRKPGDTQHTNLGNKAALLMKEEQGKASFTHVIISELRTDHFVSIRRNPYSLAKELAHAYHYYVHGYSGSHGNVEGSVEINVTEYRDGKEDECISLRDIEDDAESNFNNSAAEDTYEFQITVPMRLGAVDEEKQPVGKKEGVIKGIMRYHPYKFNQETFPQGEVAEDENLDEDSEQTSSGSKVQATNSARGNRPIFECFWNGRLIPHTQINDFPWCAAPLRDRSKDPIPLECYYRVSGALFTNDLFKVSTNKLAFMDLEDKLNVKNKTLYENVFVRVIDGQPKRTKDMAKDFRQWLSNCHKKYDKQILFSNHVQNDPHDEDDKTKFKTVEWGERRFTVGDIVRTQRKIPIRHGRIRGFYLEGKHTEDVHATDGFFKLELEPSLVYNGETELIPLRFLDRAAGNADVKKTLAIEKNKLPASLVYQWDKESFMNEHEDGTRTIKAGQKIGYLKVLIRSRELRDICTLPGARSRTRQLGIRQEIIRHAEGQSDEVILAPVDNWTPESNHQYWFMPIENGTDKLGEHTMILHCIMKDGTSVVKGVNLPTTKIPFTVVVGKASKFHIDDPIGDVSIGVPFSIRLSVLDDCGYSVPPKSDLSPLVTMLDDPEEKFVVSQGANHVDMNNNTVEVRDVLIKGALPKKRKSHSLQVTITNEMWESQSFKINPVPGRPHTLELPNPSIDIENGQDLTWKVEIKDCCGNSIVTDEEIVVCCEFEEPHQHLDCRATYHGGKASFKEKKFTVEGISNDHAMLLGKINLPGYADVQHEELSIRVRPRPGPCKIKVYRSEGDDLDKTYIQCDEEIKWLAGETIHDLKFEVLDEGRNNLKISKQIAKSITLDWDKGKRATEKSLMNGELPLLPVPEQVSGERQKHTIRLGKDLEFSFYIRALPGEAAKLKCSTDHFTQRIRIGETFSIQVKTIDEYGNIVPQTSVDKESVKLCTNSGTIITFNQIVLYDDGSFLIEEVECNNSFLPGKHNLVIQYGNLHNVVPIEVEAGIPTKLIRVGRNPSEVIHAYNGKPISRDIIFELLDKDDNVIRENSYKVELNCGMELEIVSEGGSPISSINSDGQAVFSNLTFSGNFDEYYVYASVQVENQPAIEQPIRVRIEPDPDKPERIECQYNGRDEYTAGSLLTPFDVCLVAEAGNTMTSVNREDVSLVYAPIIPKPESPEKESDSGEKTVLHPDESDDVEPGHFSFNNLKAPKCMGRYIYAFEIKNEDSELNLESNEIYFTVRPERPVRLVGVNSDKMPYVSNSEVDKSRIIFDEILLHLEDRFGNPCEPSITGNVNISITGNCSTDDLPTLEASTQLLISLHDGLATAKNIAIQEGCPGIDGKQYSLTLDFESADHDVEPFVHPFVFCNDVAKQQRMIELESRKCDLESKISTFEKEQDAHEKRVANITGEIAKREKEVQVNLQTAGEDVKTFTMEQILQRLRKLEKKLRTLILRPRRTCDIPPYPVEGQDVLGKVAHLAEMSDIKEATVVSRYLEGSMECIVTRTARQARQIFNKSQGLQRVWPLEGIRVTTLTPFIDKTLKHPLEKLHRSRSSTANPVYATLQLVFPQHEAECKKVFDALLGDTIIIETFDDALKYQQQMENHSLPCPTILTRQGCAGIDRNGAFVRYSAAEHAGQSSGDGDIFAESLPELCNQLRKEIDVLKKAVDAYKALDDLQEELAQEKILWECDDKLGEIQQYNDNSGQLIEILKQLNANTDSSISGQRKRRRSTAGDEPAKRRLL